MTKDVLARALPLVILVQSLAGPALADAKDYRFQLVRDEMKVGEAMIDVRLLHRRTGQPVTNAVILARRIDMAPDGMETMVSKVERMPASEPGVSRFRTKLTMPGGWRLSLGANVPGETDTVEGKLVLRATR